jgi:hypothetical protein
MLSSVRGIDPDSALHWGVVVIAIVWDKQIRFCFTPCRPAKNFLNLGKRHAFLDAFAVAPVDAWTGPKTNGQCRCHRQDKQAGWQ